MLKTLIWVGLGVVALIFVGWLVLSLLGTLVKLAFYLLVGAAVVGGAALVLGKARQRLRGSDHRQLP